MSPDQYNTAGLGTGRVDALCFNKVLLEGVPAQRSLTETGLDGVISSTVSPDYSIVPFLVEEFVALGATDVVLITSEDPRYISSVIVPEILPRILIEEDDIDDHYKVLAPVSDELGWEFKYGRGWHSIAQKRGSDMIDIREITTLVQSVKTLLAGVKYEAEIDVDLAGVVHILAKLFSICRDGRSRATVAALLAVFRAYAPIQTDAVLIKPAATDRQIRLFLTFVEDSIYREMSQAAHSLGIAAKAERATHLFSRAARALTQKTPFRQAVNLGSEIVSGATHVPVPDADVAASLFRKEYLPPVVKMDEAIKRAMQQWKRVKPAFVPAKTLLPAPDWPIPE